MEVHESSRHLTRWVNKIKRTHTSPMNTLLKRKLSISLPVSQVSPTIMLNTEHHKALPMTPNSLLGLYQVSGLGMCWDQPIQGFYSADFAAILIWDQEKKGKPWSTKPQDSLTCLVTPPCLQSPVQIVIQYVCVCVFTCSDCLNSVFLCALAVHINECFYYVPTFHNINEVVVNLCTWQWI